MVSSDYRAIARGALSGNWGTAILVSLVTVLLGGSVGGGSSSFSSASSSANYNAQSNNYYYYNHMPSFIYGFITFMAVLAVVYVIVALILGGAMTLGNCQYNIDLVTKQRPAEFGTLFSRFAYFGKALLLNLAMGLFIFLWSLLLFVPGIIAAYSYSMAPYLMAQNPNLGVMDAIRTSKELMRGNRWRLFCLQISFIGWFVLSMLTLGIGLLWYNPYLSAATTAFYLDLTRQLPGAPGYYGQPQGYQPPYPGGPYQQYQQYPGAQAQGYAQPGYPPQGQYQQPYQQQGYAQPQQPGYPPQDAYQQQYPQYPQQQPQQQAYPQQPYAQPGYPPQPGYPAAGQQPQQPVYQQPVQPVQPPQPPPAPEYNAPVQPQAAPAPEQPSAAPAAPPVYTVPVEPAVPAASAPAEPVIPVEPAAPVEPAPENPIIPPYPQDNGSSES